MLSKLFTKKFTDTNGNQEQKIDFLSAKEALNECSKHWSTIPVEEIFKQIHLEIKRGRRFVCFHRAYLTGQTLTVLRDLGYQVEIYTSDKEPFFKVSW